jgi:hypothetical protein
MAALHTQRRALRRQKLQGRTVTLAPASDLVRTAGASPGGTQRLLALLWPVIQEALAVEAAAPWQQPQAPTPVIVALPQWLSVDDCRILLDRLQALLAERGLAVDISGLRDGVDASFQALFALQRMAAQAGPGAGPMLLLAVDALCEPSQLLQQLRQGLLLHDAHDEGWVAGEAAAALWLTPATAALAATRRNLLLHRPALLNKAARQPCWPSDAEGDGHVLHPAMAQALDNAGMTADQVGCWLSDHDGSRWRAEHHGAAVGRLEAALAEAHGPTGGFVALAEQPAGLLGQVGAASGAVQWALAQLLHQHQLRPLNTALSTVLGHDGACAAVAIERLVP